MGANDGFVKIRVSKEALEQFNELVDFKKAQGQKTTYRENYDEALNFFTKVKMLPAEYGPIGEQMQKQTSRYIAFFRNAEKNIYSKIDSSMNTLGSQRTFSGGGNADVNRELNNISEVLKQLYGLIRLGFKLDLQSIQFILGEEQEDVFDKVMEDFTHTLGEIEK